MKNYLEFYTKCNFRVLHHSFSIKHLYSFLLSTSLFLKSLFRKCFMELFYSTLFKIILSPFFYLSFKKIYSMKTLWKMDYANQLDKESQIQRKKKEPQKPIGYRSIIFFKGNCFKPTIYGSQIWKIKNILQIKIKKLRTNLI